MAEDFVCEICGKRTKSAAGLAGHKMLAHSGAKAPVRDGAEIALSEILGAVKDAYERLEQRMLDLSRDYTALGDWLKKVDDRLSALDTDGRVQELESQVARLEDIRSRFREQISSPESLAELVEDAGRAGHFFDGEGGRVTFINFCIDLANKLGMDLPFKTLIVKEEEAALAEQKKGVRKRF